MFVFSFGCNAAAVEPELIDIPLKYEIKSRGDGGFFSEIHSIAVDNKSQTLYALHDDPVSISSFYLRDGNRLGIKQLDDKTIFSDATVAACEGRVFILSQRRLWEFDSKEKLQPVKIMPDAFLAKADMIACYPQTGILLLEDAPKTIDALAWNGNSIRMAAPTKSTLSNKTVFPFSSAKAFLADSDGSILLLDPDAGGIRRLTTGKIEQSGISLAGPAGSSQPWKVSSFAVDTAGNIWAVNSSLRSLDVYNPFGDLRRRVEQTTPDGFRFISPQTIAIDRENTLYVLDSGDGRIKAYDISGLLMN